MRQFTTKGTLNFSGERFNTEILVQLHEEVFWEHIATQKKFENFELDMTIYISQLKNVVLRKSILKS